jgi:hypothetical protein
MGEAFKEFQKEVRGTLETLLIVFIVLKLTDLINWSWVWVLAPFWIPACVAIVGVIIYLIIFICNKDINE